MEILNFCELGGEGNIRIMKMCKGGLVCKWDRLLLKKLACCWPVKKPEKTQGIRHTPNNMVVHTAAYLIFSFVRNEVAR